MLSRTRSLVLLGLLLCSACVVSAQEEEEEPSLGTLRPFLVETKEELEQNIKFAYEVLSNIRESNDEDPVLRPRDFCRFVELALNPHGIAMTDHQEAELDRHCTAWLQRYGFDLEESAEQRLPMGMLSRGSPLRWLLATNEELKTTQRSHGEL